MSSKIKKFYLFRVKLIRDHQKDMFDDGASRANILAAAISERPSIKLKRGAEWRLANINPIGINGGSFAIGRISQANTEKFDFEANQFVEQQDMQGPFAAVFFDASIGVVAIEDKSKVNSKVEITARRLHDLLQHTQAITSRSIACRVDKIMDPQGFIQKIMGCSHVLKFRATFTGPNPIDADAIFQKPLEVYAEATNAERGVIEVIGSNLDKENLIEVTRSNAATGNIVSAKIETRGLVENVPLKGLPASFNTLQNEEEAFVYNLMQERYAQVRHADNID